MTFKKTYRIFCKKEPSIPLFSRDWWLDAVCGPDNWDVALIEKGNDITAVLPYYIKQKFNQILLTMPKLTQTLGPWKKPTNAKYANILAQEKDLMTKLINQLPSFDLFSQNFHYTVTNWLPFYWQGFNQTTRYTYVIDDLSDINKIWDGFLPKVRTDIKKARDRFDIIISEDLEIDKFLDITELTFRRQGKKLPYKRNFVKYLDQQCSEHQSRKIFSGIDRKGNIHAAVYIVWDETSAYYLMGGGDPDFRNSGATSLILWEAIKFASTVTRKFDFEGSMVEQIERFFRAFGAIQKPYFHIYRDSRNKFTKLVYHTKNIAELIKKPD